MTSDMVIALRIGQSAGLLSNLAMIEYERVSTTERVLVINDGLINQRWLKIQSASTGNFGDYAMGGLGYAN